MDTFDHLHLLTTDNMSGYVPGSSLCPHKGAEVWGAWRDRGHHWNRASQDASWDVGKSPGPFTGLIKSSLGEEPKVGKGSGQGDL